MKRAYIRVMLAAGASLAILSIAGVLPGFTPLFLATGAALLVLVAARAVE